MRDESLALLMADPYDRMLLSELRFLTQRRLIPIKAAPGTLAPAIAKAYSVHPGDASDAPRGKSSLAEPKTACAHRPLHAPHRKNWRRT